VNAATNNINFPPLSNSTSSVVSQPPAQGSIWASAADGGPGDMNKRKLVRLSVFAEPIYPPRLKLYHVVKLSRHLLVDLTTALQKMIL